MGVNTRYIYGCNLTAPEDIGLVYMAARWYAPCRPPFPVFC